MTTTRRLLFTACALALMLVAGSAAIAQTPPPPPSFSKSFSPALIGPGSVSTLEFLIDNANSSALVTNLAFSDTLPAGMTIADPANASTSCQDGTVAAAAGGATISLGGGRVGAFASCTVSVDVTSATVGTSTNVSGNLTSSAGNSGPATADLVVDDARPGFGKAFSPSTVPVGGRSTLTFTIDNTLNNSQAIALTFVDNLPTGMVVAGPANASNTCATGIYTGGTLSAVPGTGLISLSWGGAQFSAAVDAGASCEIKVDVVAQAAGQLGNVSEALGYATVLNDFGTAGKASATLTSTAAALGLRKAFTDDPAIPGGTVTLEFTIDNRDRDAAVTGIGFSDDLENVVSGLAPSDALPSAPCGDGSTLSFDAGVLALAGGSLAPQASCTFAVTLDVPDTAGAFPNTTSAVASDQATGNAASDTLFIEPAPVLTKTTVSDPVAAGGSVEFAFEITNTSATSSATDITFEDLFPDVLTTASSVPADGSACGAGSTFTFTARTNPSPPASAVPATLRLSGASLDPGASCTFSVTLDIVVDATARIYTNTTGEITATVDGETLTGAPASYNFQVVAPPILFKEFTNDPAQPGGTVDLEFTITYDANGDGFTDFDVLDGSANIGFTDNLDAVIPGLEPVEISPGVYDLPSEPCGAGSTLTFAAGVLTMTLGVLTPDPEDESTFSCTFGVTLDVPASATSGSYTNTTSALTAEASSLNLVGESASDDLRIAGLVLSKEFVDDPVLAGEDVTLRFTIENLSASEDATDILFTDDLVPVLSGLIATGLPPANAACDPDGAGPIPGTGTLSGTTYLTFQDGALAAGESCSFDVVLSVPAGAASDSYANQTSALEATMNGAADLLFDPADDDLIVASDILALAKAFVDDPVAPGGTVTLEFTITNLSAARTITDISFTDDLNATLSGLASTGGTQSGVCGVGSQISGTSLLTFTGGSLPPGGSCTFSVSLAVPGGAAGGPALNSTSEVSGSSDGIDVIGDPATDELEIGGLEFSKQFSPLPAEIGGTVTLSFTILNTGGPVDDLSFNDDLDAVLTGLAATSTPLVDPCGSGSSLTGTSQLSFADGSLGADASCTFSVELLVPATADPGSYDNLTSPLRRGTTESAPPAAAILTVVEPVDNDGDGVFDAQDFCPDTVIPEGVPTVQLGVNRHALVDDDYDFDTTRPPGQGQGPRVTFTTTDTAGCSCEQIIAELGLGLGHVKFGCSKSAMEDWIAFLNGSPLTSDASSEGRDDEGAREDSGITRDPLRGPSLTVEIVGPGSVTSDPKRWLGGRALGLMCGGDSSCSVKFEAGTEVKLMARPEGNARFAGWSGDCYGSAQITSVTVGRDSVCTATFERAED